MTEPLQRRAIADGVWFSCIHDPKFYHNSISVTLITPLTEGKNSAAVLAAYLLRMGSRRCRDMTELECRLADLYGAVLDTDVSRHGENQLLTFSITGADDRFALEGESISRGCAELLGEILLEPRVENGAFPEEAFRLEQQYLVDTIEAEINDKRSYAAQRCTAEMGRGYRFALPRYGTVQEALSVTPHSAYERYRELLRTARIEIFFSGCGSPAYAEETFRNLFAGVERAPLSSALQPLPLRAEQPTEWCEQMPMSQSKLVLGFRTGLPQGRRARTAARVMTALLGGSTGSRLFTTVREKLGCCYYCGARINLLTGILMIECGLEEANREKLQKAILAEIADRAAGNISPQELSHIKLAFQSSLASIGDSLARTEGWYLSGLLQGDAITPEQDREEIASITAKEVAAAAAALTLDTVFFLQATGKGDGCDEEG